jgi:hypothetical protein
MMAAKPLGFAIVIDSVKSLRQISMEDGSGAREGSDAASPRISPAEQRIVKGTTQDLKID